jgi:hypothetical protein
MADWRQIQARIRKAKASTDAPAQLAELYERTRDAMVAFELARWQEKAGEHAEAARWYTAAAERFRRSQWKTKAEAALARLRAPKSPAEPGDEASAIEDVSSAASSRAAVAPSEATAQSQESDMRSEVSQSEGEPQASADTARTHLRGTSESGARATGIEESAGAEQNAGPVRKGPRRRGRRGGRNRRRPVARTGSEPAVASSPVQAESSHIETPHEEPSRVPSLPPQTVPEIGAPAEAATSSMASSMAAWRGRSRAGEPALASRMAHLESQLRRLLVCPQAKLEQAESAPAGPGVLLLSDSDQVTHYYVESCQTLRIAIGNLIRGGRVAKDVPRFKERLADNLGIAESRVTNYLKEHCGVRWLQLDEGASELAHFAIAVLRPVVNE